ncbi:hypothetical protein N7541_000736 [Penicillium brevicompactum]|uniref:Chromo domain-containing protein n=1 Tax=Penicillium brevicompactum TaxID=5074 RepID=A0A9W9RW83_PENBR|nr:hypothetical protein N7541_000736 [Penicillium brevicompactum]
MEAVWDSARKNMASAQQAQKKHADKHRQDVDFDIGDYVYLSLRGLKQERPSRKLTDRNAGPFRIVEKRRHAFKLDLPPGFDIHPVFAPEKLRLEPIKIADNEEWEVDQVLDMQLRHVKLQYKLSWKGCDPDDAWYPASNVRHAPQRVKDHTLYR